MSDDATPVKVGSHAGLGLVPERAVVAYLYHDAQTAEDAHPWLNSTMLVVAAHRRPTLRKETPLVTLAHAEAMVAAERERWVALCKDFAADTNPPRKGYEHTYCDGWLDACNEIMWAGEKA